MRAGRVQREVGGGLGGIYRLRHGGSVRTERHAEEVETWLLLVGCRVEREQREWSKVRALQKLNRRSRISNVGEEERPFGPAAKRGAVCENRELLFRSRLG